MSIELYVEGFANSNKGTGQRYEMADYTVQEDSTPLNAGDSFGGTGQLSFDVVEEGSSIEYLYDRNVEITDGTAGRFAGHVNSISAEDGIASVIVDSLQSRLNGDTIVPPYVGTLGGAIQFYCAYAAIPANRILVDGSVSSRRVVYPGWRGSIWNNLKQLLAVEQVELTEVSSNIVVRPPRQREGNRNTDSSVSWSVSDQNLARYVEVYNYNAESRAGSLVYPTNDGSVISVASGETTIVQASLSASLSSVNQPVPLLTLNGSDQTRSVYTVINSDGIAIQPATWLRAGGEIRVEIGDDSSSLLIYVTGAQMLGGPFRIATADTAGENLPSLRITGSGVFYRKELIRVRTGAPSDRAVQDVGTTVDSPFISDAGKAYTVAYALAGKYAGPSVQISTELNVANRPGEEGVVSAVTFGEFNAIVTGQRFSQFNTNWSGKTFGDVTDYLYALKDKGFENQAFGNVAGSRLMERLNRFRVRSATISPRKITIQADSDTTVSDFNAAMAGKTFSVFNSLWQNGTYSDLTIRPLRVE